MLTTLSSAAARGNITGQIPALNSIAAPVSAMRSRTLLTFDTIAADSWAIYVRKKLEFLTALVVVAVVFAAGWTLLWFSTGSGVVLNDMSPSEATGPKGQKET